MRVKQCICFHPWLGIVIIPVKMVKKTCEDILLTSINSGDIPWYLVLLLYCYTFDPPAQQQYINDFPLTYTFKTSTRKLLQISRLEVQKKLPSKPLMQNSEFKTGASLSSISVAFHGEVIVEHWEKKSLDYRQYIHMLPREGVSKRLSEPAFAS